MKIKWFLFVIIIITSIIYCSKNEGGNSMIYEEVKRIELSQPIAPRNFTILSDYIIGLNAKNMFIYLYDKSGKLLFKYDKQGRAPGEFSKDFILLGAIDSLVFFADQAQSKIVSLKIDKESNSLLFNDEFRLNVGGILTGGVFGEEIFVVSLFGDYQLTFFNTKGDKTREYLEFPKDAKPSNDFIAKMMKRVAVTDKHIAVANVVDGVIDFYAIEGTDLKKLKSQKLQGLINGDYKTDSKTEEGREEVAISAKGIGLLKSYNNEFYAKASGENNNIEIYSNIGDYLGVCTITNKPDTNISSLFFANNSNDIFYYEKIVKGEETTTNDSLLVQCKLKSIK